MAIIYVEYIDGWKICSTQRPYACMEPAGPLHNHMCNMSTGTMSLAHYERAAPVVCRQPVYMQQVRCVLDTSGLSHTHRYSAQHMHRRFGMAVYVLCRTWLRCLS